MRRKEFEVTQELKEKVIRCYTEKNMSVDMIAKLVCPRYITLQILEEAKIPLKTRGQGMREDTRFEYRARHTSYKKLS